MPLLPPAPTSRDRAGPGAWLVPRTNGQDQLDGDTLGPLHPTRDPTDSSCPFITARGNKLRGCSYKTRCRRVFLRFASCGCRLPFPCQASSPGLLVMNDLGRVPPVPGVRSCEAFFPGGCCRWLLRRRARSCTLPARPSAASARPRHKGTENAIN